jgi:hypothetical protein
MNDSFLLWDELDGLSEFCPSICFKGQASRDPHLGCLHFHSPQPQHPTYNKQKNAFRREFLGILSRSPHGHREQSKEKFNQ